MKINVNGVGVLAQRPSNKLGGGIAEFIDYDAQFEQCIHIVSSSMVTHSNTSWLVGILRIECIWIVA